LVASPKMRRAGRSGKASSAVAFLLLAAVAAGRSSYAAAPDEILTFRIVTPGP